MATTFVGFWADEETRRAIAELEAALGSGIRNPKSVAIRRGLIDAAAALRGANGSK